jgi:hypothetical protein
MYYFGTGTADEAMLEWLRIKDDALAGRKPRPKPEESIRLADACNQFLNAKRQKWHNSEITGRTWLSYFNTCQRLTFKFGRERAVTDLTVEDWQILRDSLAKTRVLRAVENGGGGRPKMVALGW